MRLKTLLKTISISAGFIVSAAATSLAAIPLTNYAGVATQTQADMVTANYYMVPEPIRLKFENMAGRISFRDGSSDTGWLGQYERKDTTIYITNLNFGGAEAVTHEMGHFFDDILIPDTEEKVSQSYYRGVRITKHEDGKQYLSQEPVFQRIYMQEKKASPVSDYEKQSSLEYFAGSFRMYCVSPELLKENAPETYGYIDGLVKNFK